MNFLQTQKQVRISHGKQVIRVPVIEVLLNTAHFTHYQGLALYLNFSGDVLNFK